MFVVTVDIQSYRGSGRGKGGSMGRGRGGGKSRDRGSGRCVPFSELHPMLLLQVSAFEDEEYTGRMDIIKLPRVNSLVAFHNGVTCFGFKVCATQPCAP